MSGKEWIVRVGLDSPHERECVRLVTIELARSSAAFELWHKLVAEVGGYCLAHGGAIEEPNWMNVSAGPGVDAGRGDTAGVPQPGKLDHFPPAVENCGCFLRSKIPVGERPPGCCCTDKIGHCSCCVLPAQGYGYVARICKHPGLSPR